MNIFNSKIVDNIDYDNIETIDDLVNFMVGKILNYLNIDNNLFNKWEDTEYET